MASKSKNPGVFFALAKIFKKNDSYTQTAILTFASVEAADQWWTAVYDNGAVIIDSLKKDDIERHGPQWFSFGLSDSKSAADIFRKFEGDTKMSAVRSRWSWKALRPEETNGSAPNIPLQDESGWPVQDETMNTTLSDIRDSLQNINESNNSLGDNWDDGPNWEGGSNSYQLVENAYRKAQNLKSQGDDRSFGMIFAQLSMELRRKV